MGYADAMRFMNLYELGRGDYTRDRDTMLPNWAAEDLGDAARKVCGALE